MLGGVYPNGDYKHPKQLVLLQAGHGRAMKLRKGFAPLGDVAALPTLPAFQPKCHWCCLDNAYLFHLRIKASCHVYAQDAGNCTCA